MGATQRKEAAAMMLASYVSTAVGVWCLLDGVYNLTKQPHLTGCVHSRPDKVYETSPLFKTGIVASAPRWWLSPHAALGSFLSICTGLAIFDVRTTTMQTFLIVGYFLMFLWVLP